MSARQRLFGPHWEGVPEEETDVTEVTEVTEDVDVEEPKLVPELKLVAEEGEEGCEGKEDEEEAQAAGNWMQKALGKQRQHSPVHDCVPQLSCTHCGVDPSGQSMVTGLQVDVVASKNFVQRELLGQWATKMEEKVAEEGEEG